MNKLIMHAHRKQKLGLKNDTAAGRGVTWVKFCWVCAAGLSEPLPHYSLFCGQL